MPGTVAVSGTDATVVLWLRNAFSAPFHIVKTVLPAQINA